MTKQLSVAAKRAIKAYGLGVCTRAYAEWKQGNGASTIGWGYGLTTRQADAAINAGRELSI